MNINMNDDAILLEVKIAPDTSYENIIDSMSLNNNFVSSVRSSSGYHGLLHTRSSSATHFSKFSNSSDSKVKVKVKGPNMCYIFEKHGIQGYRI